MVNKKEYMKQWRKNNPKKARGYELDRDRKKYYAKYYQTNKDKKREYNKKYRKKNIGKLRVQKREYDKIYRKENKEKIRGRDKKYRERNKAFLIKKRKAYYEENKEKVLEQQKKYGVKNKDRINERARNRYRTDEKVRTKDSERHKKYYETNREVMLVKHKKYSRKNKDKIKKYRLENKAKIKEYHKKYNVSPHGRLIKRLNSQKRRAKKGKIIHSFTKEQWLQKLDNTKGICPAFGREPHYVGINKLSLDHIFPISKAEEGRVYTIEDVQPLCMGCNSTKNITEVIYYEKRNIFDNLFVTNTLRVSSRGKNIHNGYYSKNC